MLKSILLKEVLLKLILIKMILIKLICGKCYEIFDRIRVLSISVYWRCSYVYRKKAGTAVITGTL